MRSSALFATLLFALSTLTSAVSSAVPVGIPPENEIRPEQYARTCSPLALYALTATTSGTAKVVRDASGIPVVVRWGTQVDVTCLGDSVTDTAYVVFHQEPDQKFLSLLRMGYTALGTNPGYGFLNVNDASGTSGNSGPVPGFMLPANGTTKYKRVSAAPFNGTLSTKAPTTRRGRCTAVSNSKNQVGGPCATNAECGSSSGVCSTTTGRPDGVFVSVLISDYASTICYVELCF